MQQVQPSLIARPHTVLGVCEGIGEDLGFNPVYLRIAIAAGIFFAPVAVVATYLALGCVVAFARWSYPVSNSATRAVTEQAEAEPMRIAA